MIKNLLFSDWLKRLIPAILILGILGCTPESPLQPVPPTEDVIETEVFVEPAVTDTPEEPAAVPTLLLVSSTDADPAVFSLTHTTLERLAADSGMTIMILESLEPADINQNVVVVIGVGQNLGFTGLANGAPEVGFVVINDPEVSPQANLSVIGDPAVNSQQQAFLAGYLSAVISTDYKVAALIAGDIERSSDILNAYVTGVRFFCGSCRPLHPPYGSFPQWETLTADEAAPEFELVLTNLRSSGIEVVYVEGTLASPELLSALADSGFKVVGDKGPDVQRNNWVGTVAIDPSPALIQLWPALLQGSGGEQYPASFTLVDTEAGLVSDGRYRLFEEMAKGLAEGLVSVVPVP